MHHNADIIEASGLAVRAGRANDRRGVAMLLALCAVATATIVTASYVASRENTPSIAGNALDATSAKWAAESAGDLAVAALETGLDLTDPSALLSSIAIAGGTASVAITDLDGNDPAPDASQVIVTISATVGGVTSTSQRIVQLTPPVPLDECIDPELGEFGIFATDSLTLEATSAIVPWSASPDYAANNVVNVGVGFSSDGSLSVNSSAALVNTRLFPGKRATTSLKSQVSNAKFAVGGGAIPVDVPALRAALPAAATGLTTRLLVNSTILSTRGLAAGRYQDVTVDNGAVVTLSGVYSFADLRLEDNAVLRIDGDVTVHCRDDFEVVRGSAIEYVDASSRVRFFVSDSFELTDAAIGVDRAISRNTSRWVGSMTQYIDPGRLRIYALNTDSGGAASPAYTIQTNSIMIGTLIAPGSTIDIKAGSAVIGRLTGGAVKIYTGGWFVSDPALDRGQGFTKLDGPLYTDSGAPVAGLEDVLEDMVADVTDLLTVTTDLLGGLLGGGDDGGEISEAPSEEVTPRTADSAVAKTWPTLARSLEQSVESEAPSNGLLVNVNVGGDAEALEIE